MKKTVILSSMLAALLIAGACSDTDIYSSETTRPAVGIDDKSLTLDGKTESARISIASNIWWKAHVEYDGGGEWLEITPAEGFGDIEITVATERNYDLSTPKTARLVIVSDDGKGSFRKEFTVTQQTSEPYIEIDGLQSEGLAVGVTRSETPLTLYTNDAWEASTSDDSWCSVVSSDNGSGKKTVQLVCASNSTKRERSAEVTFRSKNTPGVVCSFRVNQSGIFAAPVLTLAKDESGAIRLAWDAVMGAVKYMVVLTDNNGAPIAEIDNGAETACDLSAQEVFAKPEYVGLFNVSIRALSDDPEVFSNSEAQSANSHFASGAGTQGDPFIIDRDGYLRNISHRQRQSGRMLLQTHLHAGTRRRLRTDLLPGRPLRGHLRRQREDHRRMGNPSAGRQAQLLRVLRSRGRRRRSGVAQLQPLLALHHQRRRFGQ